MWLAGLQLHHTYGDALACRPVGSFTCRSAVHAFNNSNNFLANGLILQTVPVLIGAFVGAPVLAREMETGTYRYAWTQGFERWRWALAKLVALAVMVSAAAGVFSLVVSWYYQPYFSSGNERLGLTQLSTFSPGLFDVRGLALGYAAGGLLRAHYLAPVTTARLNVSSSAWVLSEQWKTTQGGHLVSQSALSQVLQRGGAQIAGKGGIPRSLASWRYLVRHGFTQWTTYQPASRFWTFQWIESGWLLALSVVLIALSVWFVRRRSA
jgi:hypothetical protein